MDFEYRISSTISSAENALNLANSLKKEYEAAKDFTNTLLCKCADAGIKRVSIGKKSKNVPITDGWPFEAAGNIFQFPSDASSKDGWPAIWGVVRDLGISGGAGNNGQHQISTEGDRKLVDGVYELKKGVWKKIE